VKIYVYSVFKFYFSRNLNIKRTTGRKSRKGRDYIFEKCNRLHKEGPNKSYKEELIIFILNT
jgi:hypothetical protein